MRPGGGSESLPASISRREGQAPSSMASIANSMPAPQISSTGTQAQQQQQTSQKVTGQPVPLTATATAVPALLASPLTMQAMVLRRPNFYEQNSMPDLVEEGDILYDVLRDRIFDSSPHMSSSYSSPSPPSPLLRPSSNPHQVGCGGFGLQPFLTLPTKVGTYLVHESFRAFMVFHNAATYPLSTVSIRVESVQPNQQRTMVLRHNIAGMPGKSNYSCNVEMPLAELGSHTLSVNVTYTDPSSETRRFTWASTVKAEQGVMEVMERVLRRVVTPASSTLFSSAEGMRNNSNSTASPSLLHNDNTMTTAVAGGGNNSSNSGGKQSTRTPQVSARPSMEVSGSSDITNTTSATAIRQSGSGGRQASGSGGGGDDYHHYDEDCGESGCCYPLERATRTYLRLPSIAYLLTVGLRNTAAMPIALSDVRLVLAGGGSDQDDGTGATDNGNGQRWASSARATGVCPFSLISKSATDAAADAAKNLGQLHMAPGEARLYTFAFRISSELLRRHITVIHGGSSSSSSATAAAVSGRILSSSPSSGSLGVTTTATALLPQRLCELGRLEWRWSRESGDGGIARGSSIHIGRLASLPSIEVVVIGVRPLPASSASTAAATSGMIEGSDDTEGPFRAGQPLELHCVIINHASESSSSSNGPSASRDVALKVRPELLAPDWLYAGPAIRPLGFLEPESVLPFTLALLPWHVGWLRLAGGVELVDARNPDAVLWPRAPMWMEPVSTGALLTSYQVNSKTAITTSTADAPASGMASPPPPPLPYQTATVTPVAAGVALQRSTAASPVMTDLGATTAAVAKDALELKADDVDASFLCELLVV